MPTWSGKLVQRVIEVCILRGVDDAATELAKRSVVMVLVQTCYPGDGSAMLAQGWYISMKSRCCLTSTCFVPSWGQLVCEGGSQSSKPCNTHKVGSMISGGHLWQL